MIEYVKVIVSCPLFVMLPRVRTKNIKYSLNLNIYRNTYHQTLNEAKVIFKKLLTPQIKALPIFEIVSGRYILYPPTKRLCDTDNITCVVNKFFQDALVELKRLSSDDYTKWIDTSSTFGCIDKINPRCDIILTGITKPLK